MTTRAPRNANALSEVDPWDELRRFTPARIAIGRSGASLPTRALLDFDLAHARARDAVHAPLDTAPLCSGLSALGMATVEVQSAAGDRAQYLLRPDLGRRLSPRSAHALQALADTQRQAPDLLVVIADGLSALAVQSHALAVCEQLLRQTPAGWRCDTAVLASQARVALGDPCGALLGAGMVAVLIGERPGLSSADSLGIYLTARPRAGLTDADRNCISNIHRAGLSAAQAAAKLWWLACEARRLGRTGVDLKDESDVLLPDAGPALSDI